MANSRGWACSQSEAARNRPAAGPQRSGRDHGFQHRHEIPARRPQHRGEPEGQRQRHGQRLAHGRHLALAQIRHPGRGGEQMGGVDAPVGLEDHCFGRWRRGRHDFGEAPGRQGVAPGRDKPGTPAPGAERPHGHVERAFELEPGVEQVGDGLETIHPRLAPHDEDAQKPQPYRRTVHRKPPRCKRSASTGSA